MTGATLELIRTIALLCSVSTLENTKGSWTELPDTALYQQQCQVYYLDCVENQKGLIEDRLIKCIRDRKIKGKK